jgi:hypothetical protein
LSLRAAKPRSSGQTTEEKKKAWNISELSSSQSMSLPLRSNAGEE